MASKSNKSKEKFGSFASRLGKNVAGSILYPRGKRLLSTYMNAPIGIAECSLDGMYINVNDEFCRITGYQKEELLTRNDKDISHEDDYATEMKLQEQLVAGEIVSYQLEKRYIRKDCAIIWTQVIRSLVRESKRKPLYAVGIVQDITEKRQAEAQIKFQADLLENVHDAIIATDDKLQITAWNRAAEELYGWASPEVLGRSIIEVTQSELASEQRTPILDQIDQENFSITEVIHRHKDGHPIYVEARSIPLRGDDGKLTGYVTSVMDITQRKQAEQALHKLNLQLETLVQSRTVELNNAILTLRAEISERKQAEAALLEAGKRLQELSGRLVEAQENERRALARELHDRLGQTLSALNLNLTLMNGQLSEDAKQQLGSRLEDSLHLVAEASSLIRNVMADLRPAELDEYGLEAALQSYITEFTSRYGIKVFFDHSQKPIPRLGLGIEVTLLRIAQEAMTNVARHAHADQITLSLQKDENKVRMTIQDNGVGMPAFQESTHHGNHGLIFMRERAEAVGGNFQVFSTPTAGTRIEVTITVENGTSKVQLSS